MKKSPRNKVLHGNSLDLLRTLPDGSIDSIVTDPPYELGFMGKSWDASGIAYNVELWAECLRVLKPGGHMLAFGGTRTYHRMAVAIEDAGFEIRDSIHWIYGSGFPKSLNLKNEHEGWGTALKPAHEPVVLARKPLEGAVVANVKEHGTGAINIDGCRITYAGDDTPAAGSRTATFGTQETVSGGDGSGGWEADGKGRWPANVIFDGAAGAELGEQARFFYCAKPSKKERNAGLDGLQDRRQDEDDYERAGTTNPRNRSQKLRKNFHPTVKPVALMRYLVRLVTPPNGVVLDPFLGSGTTAVAAILEGFDWLGCEMTEDYLPIIKGRVAWAKKQTAEQQLSLLEDNQ